MPQQFVSARAHGLHSGDDLPAMPSISLISMSGNAHATSIGLIVPPPVAEREWIHLSLGQQTVIPIATSLVLIMIFTLSFLLGSLVKARPSPS